MVMRLIIENLCSNAAKYSPAKSMIDIELLEKTAELLIRFKNQGNPISEKDQKNIFEPFHRTVDATNSYQKGWGLGLPLVRGLVEAHGGKITVTSNAADGTCFEVTIPKE